ncbi:DUF2189 domain-containing protein [Blastochloris viridis]|uniref:Membrane protein n=1 Tax=Blastochloris viridis TaxID=1079 RepID=A0A0H5BBZ7_BLAVI|nr:DUF2189 domain-containing protein [Blastochloris viridis]ALK10284.1 hypothetical protein BVIR_2518 [Blastochloris viridis]BAR99782.1 membrane protein [Blastochloris viridis]CUU42946.1 putative integral membrane protein [Blastochloris viridis]
MAVIIDAARSVISTKTTRVSASPQVLVIDGADIKAAFAAGFADFKAAPQFGLFFGGLYAAAGLVLCWAAFVSGWVFLVFPLAAGFVLVGPFVAVGLYEVSRRREQGLPLSWRAILGAIRGQSQREIVMLGFVLTFVLVAWVKLATLLYALTFGLHTVSPRDLLDVILTTPRGLVFLVAGNALGALIAFVVFAISVMSFPCLLDRDVDFATGIATSIEAVKVNPGPMFAFALAVAGLLAVAVAPLFLLLPVVLPVLGHATWHLYRRTIA